jgi:hypothetical protein
MTFEELSSEALIANLHHHRELAEKAMKEADFHIERAKVYDEELKRREKNVVQ